jgi:hypothetical protein
LERRLQQPYRGSHQIKPSDCLTANGVRVGDWLKPSTREINDAVGLYGLHVPVRKPTGIIFEVESVAVELNQPSSHNDKDSRLAASM